MDENAVLNWISLKWWSDVGWIEVARLWSVKKARM